MTSGAIQYGVPMKVFLRPTVRSSWALTPKSTEEEQDQYQLRLKTVNLQECCACVIYIKKYTTQIKSKNEIIGNTVTALNLKIKNDVQSQTAGVGSLENVTSSDLNLILPQKILFLAPGPLLIQI